MSIDISIINACKQNNVIAQRELYNKYSAVYFGICYRYALCKEDAEDMLQEGFIRIFRGIDEYRNNGSFEAWMKKIIVNTCINYVQKNKKFLSQVQIENAHHISIKQESIASKLLGKQVMACLMQMPIGYRTIINLYAIEGYTHREIASLLDIDEGTSRSQYIRGKQILENILIQRKLIPNTNVKLDWLNILHAQ